MSSKAWTWATVAGRCCRAVVEQQEQVGAAVRRRVERDLDDAQRAARLALGGEMELAVVGDVERSTKRSAWPIGLASRPMARSAKAPLAASDCAVGVDQRGHACPAAPSRSPVSPAMRRAATSTADPAVRGAEAPEQQIVAGAGALDLAAACRPRSRCRRRSRRRRATPCARQASSNRRASSSPRSASSGGTRRTARDRRCWRQQRAVARSVSAAASATSVERSSAHAAAAIRADRQRPRRAARAGRSPPSRTPRRPPAHARPARKAGEAAAAPTDHSSNAAAALPRPEPATSAAVPASRSGAASSGSASARRRSFGAAPYQIRTRSPGARYSFWPGCTLKAAYQGSRLRTIAARCSRRRMRIGQQPLAQVRPRDSCAARPAPSRDRSAGRR